MGFRGPAEAHLRATLAGDARARYDIVETKASRGPLTTIFRCGTAWPATYA